MILSPDTIEIFCAQQYENICCNINEFRCDLKRVHFIRRLLDKYLSSGILKDRLLLNHFISFFNVFSVNGGVRILFYFMNDIKYHSALKTILMFLNRCPNNIDNLDINNIEIDELLLDRLNKL